MRARQLILRALCFAYGAQRRVRRWAATFLSSSPYRSVAEATWTSSRDHSGTAKGTAKGTVLARAGATPVNVDDAESQQIVSAVVLLYYRQLAEHFLMELIPFPSASKVFDDFHQRACRNSGGVPLRADALDVSWINLRAATRITDDAVLQLSLQRAIDELTEGDPEMRVLLASIFTLLKDSPTARVPRFVPRFHALSHTMFRFALLMMLLLSLTPAVSLLRPSRLPPHAVSLAVLGTFE